jgi:hypothetical protein
MVWGSVDRSVFWCIDIQHLWEIFGLAVAFYKRTSIIMLQKSSARKGFCAEGLRFWRVKWYIQYARSVVFAGLPAWVYFFEKKFSRAEGCAESSAESSAEDCLKIDI